MWVLPSSQTRREIEMDASDYLKTPEVKAQMDRIRAEVVIGIMPF